MVYLGIIFLHYQYFTILHVKGRQLSLSDGALQWFSSCGNLTVMQLRNLSNYVMTHTAILAIRARHQNSPWWLEIKAFLPP